MLYPGPGRDEVYGGRGDDIVFVFNECELEVGEILHGGRGYDILVSPVPEDELARTYGVGTFEFEEVIVSDSLATHSACRTLTDDSTLRFRSQVMESIP